MLFVLYVRVYAGNQFVVLIVSTEVACHGLQLR
jgi:hypothetical protein